MSMFRNIVMARSIGGGNVGTNTKYGATIDTFLGDVDVSGVLQVPTGQADLMFDGVTDLANEALFYKFYQSPVIRSASFPQLVQLTGNSALHRCFQDAPFENISFPVLQSVSGYMAFGYAFYNTSIKTVSFPALTTVSGQGGFSSAFYGCKKLTSASFPVLEEVTGGSSFDSCFNGCSALTSVVFPKLKKIGNDTATSFNYLHFGSAFANTKVTSLEFPELTAIYCTGHVSSWGTFYGNNTIQKMYFPKLTVIDKSPAYAGTISVDAHKNIFSGCNRLTEIHFGAANRAAIEATEGYSTLWGRGEGKATVYFDL